MAGKAGGHRPEVRRTYRASGELDRGDGANTGGGMGGGRNSADTRQELGSSEAPDGADGWEAYTPPDTSRALGMRVAVTGAHWWMRLRLGGDAWRALGSPARVRLSYNPASGELGIEAAAPRDTGPGTYACCKTYDTRLVFFPAELRRRYGLDPETGRYPAELRGLRLVVNFAHGPEDDTV